MSERRLLSIGVMLLALSAHLLGIVGIADAAEEPAVTIREAAMDEGGAVRLVVSVGGPLAGAPLPAEAFAVREGEEAIEGVAVTPLLETRTEPVSVALLIDVSGSTAGRPLADAKAGATTFLGLLPSEVQVEVVAFGQKASIAQRFTTDRAALRAAIARLSAGGETALYDGVVLGANRLAKQPGQHNLVAFSDGKDTISGAKLPTALAAARNAKAPVNTVGLLTADFDRAALSALATGTGGKLLAVGQSRELAGAFGQVAREIASQYVLTYARAPGGPPELELTVAVEGRGVSAADQVALANLTEAPGPAPAPQVEVPFAAPPKPPVPALASRTGLYTGIAAVFIGALLFLGVLLLRPADARGNRLLRRMRAALRTPKREEARAEESGLAATALGRTAMDLIEKVPRSSDSRQRLQLSLDRAGFPLRAAEFQMLQALAAAGGALLGFVLLQRWWTGILLALAGALVPEAFMRRRIETRRATFLSQLPDTLQLLAGSLQAGYGFMQGLDTLVQEAAPPTSTEFARVLSEARLGMPADEALTSMADRIDSDDFRWVVLAINIQRQVGGNLAALLQTVAATLREREQVRRQIRVLSAEGRLSATILTVLPFALAGYIMLVNPGYINKLFQETVGRIMLVGALALMGAGIAWMRKIIRIDV